MANEQIVSHPQLALRRRSPSLDLGPTRRRRLRWWPAGLFLAAAFLVFLRTWRHPATVVPGFPDDNQSFLWGLEWFAFALRHGHDPFITTYIHAPAGINVFWNAWTPVLAVILAPLTLIAGPEASYNVLVTASLAVSGLAGWRAATRFVRPGTAVAVGLAYELSPYMLGHGSEDPMLAFAFFPPVVLLLVMDLYGNRRSPVRTGVLLGLATAAQVWVDEEVAADLALVVGCALVIGVLFWRSDLMRSWRIIAVAGGVAAVVATALSSPVLLIQFLGPDHLTGLIRSPFDSNSIDLADLVKPTSAELLGHAERYPVSPLESVETTGYLGLLPVLAIMATVRPRLSERWVRVAAVLALLVGSLSVGVNLTVNGVVEFYPMPWVAVSKLPLLGQLQPARLSLEVFLLVVLTAAAGYEQLRAARPAVARTLGVVTALSLLPFLPASGTTRPSVPEFFRTGATALPAGCLAAVAPVAYNGPTGVAMVWQAAAHFRFRMMGGYVLGPLEAGQQDVYSPQPYPIVAWLTSHDDASATVPDVSDAQAREDIRTLGVCALVVGEPARHQPLVTDIEKMLGREPVLTGGVALWLTPSGT